MESFPDGSRMVRNTISLGELPENLRIQIRIAGGVTFSDGTIERWITAADFDEYGTYTYDMLMPKTSYKTCHFIRVYQGDTLLNKY